MEFVPSICPVTRPVAGKLVPNDDLIMIAHYQIVVIVICNPGTCTVWLMLVCDFAGQCAILLVVGKAEHTTGPFVLIETFYVRPVRIR